MANIKDSLVYKAKTKRKKVRPPVYGSWYAMYRYCTGRAPEKARKLYEGISFFPEWRDYKTFEKWAFENGWQKGLFLTRRDKTKDFTPENCFWTTLEEANGWRSVVHRLPDGRTVRDVIGRENLGKDKKRHYCITRRVFESGWDVVDAARIPVFSTSDRRRNSKGEFALERKMSSPE